MQRNNMAIIAVVAVVVLVCAVFSYTQQGGGDDDAGIELPVPITDDLRDRPPVDEFDARVEAMLDETSATLMSETSTEQQIRDALESTYGLFDEMKLYYNVNYWDYCRDPYTYADEQVAWNTTYITFGNGLMDCIRESQDGPHADTVEQIVGKNLVEQALSSPSMTDEQMELTRMESELEAQYAVADLSDRDAVSGIYLELVDVRNELAASYGYGSYAEYAYAEVYHRAYGPEDAAVLYDEIPAMFHDSLKALYTVVDQDWPDFTYGDQQDLFDIVAPFAHSVSDEFGEMFDYMSSNGLIDFEELDTKVPGAFSQYDPLSDGYIDFIYADPSRDASDVITLVHEFGHAASMGLYGDTPVDVSEIQSQGLESLFYLKAEEYLGEDGESVRNYGIRNLVDSLLYQLLIDEFEQRVYAGEADTSEELDALFAELLTEYGYSPGDNWQAYHHLFDYPFYCIGYATSAFSSLEIFTDGLTDYDAAVDEYLAVASFDGTYSELPESLGMMDFFDPEDVETLADAIAGYVATIA